MKSSNCSYDYDLYAKSNFYLKLNRLINYNFFYDLVANPGLNKLHGCAFCRDKNINFGKVRKTKYLVVFYYYNPLFYYCYEFCSKKHLKIYTEKNTLIFNSSGSKTLIFDRSNFYKIEETILKLELLK